MAVVAARRRARAAAARCRPAEADVDIEGGRLRLHWQALPPRQIALVRLPRLAVQFRFEGLSDDARQRFMRYFDLYMQRGGG